MGRTPTPVVLDSYFTLLENAGYNTFRSAPGLSGRMRQRAQVMTKAGLIESRIGQGGGYLRSRGLCEIRLSEVIPLWSAPDNPLARLFYHWGDCSVREILSWPVPDIKGRDVTLHSALPILKMLSTETSLTATMIEQKGFISGYTGILLSNGVKFGFLKRQFPKGYALVKPFDEMTVGDIIPVLSHRGRISSAILFHSRDILLKHIYV